jgi:uncharacterized membrane protein
LRAFSPLIRAILGVAIALGCGLRFYHLEQKFYWFDEAFTSLRISGDTEAELIAWLNQPRPVSVAELLQTFQLPNQSLWDTVRSLAAEEPQHPPLYFAIAHLWLQGWRQLGLDQAIAAIRSLSAVFSLLTVPLIGWLSWLLFGSAQVSWVAMGLLAVSPFQVLYAQEAREYSLWTVMILWASVLLLRAVRTRTDPVISDRARFNWGLYAVSLGLGLYTFPSTLLVMVSHGFYVGAIARFKLNQLTKSYLLASLIGLLIFTPWLFILITNAEQVNRTFVRLERSSLPALLLGWAVNLCRLFLDYADYEREITYSGLVRPVEYAIYALLGLGFTILVGYAFYFLDRAAKQSRLFIFLLTGVISLPIALINLCIGGKQSLVLRYLMPSALGVILAVAFLIASQLSKPSGKKQTIWQIVLALVLAGGIGSCIASAQAQFWWTKSHSDMDYLAAPAINQSDRPLLISDAPMGRILAFAHLLDPTVGLQLQPACFSCGDRAAPIQERLTELDPSYKTIFLYNPSQLLLENFQRKQLSSLPVYLDSIHAEQKILKLQEKD